MTSRVVMMPCCVVGPSRVVMMPSRVVMMPSRVVILRVLDARGSRPYGESDKNQDEGGQYSGSHSPGCHINKGSAQDLANSSLQYGNELIDPKVHEGPMEPSKTRTIQCVSGDGETRVTSTIGPERVPKPQSWCKNPAFSGYGLPPATRARTDRRRISAVRASQTPGFEYVVRDGAFSARADFQPVPRGLTHRPVTTQARCARSVVAPENEKREM